MDWIKLLNDIIDILLPAVGTVAVIWFSILGSKLQREYQLKVQTEDAKLVIDNVVKFVQQVYYKLDGDEKMVIAVQRASELLAGKKIDISPAEITLLIESAVYGLKQGFNETNVTEAEVKEIAEETVQETVCDINETTVI